MGFKLFLFRSARPPPQFLPPSLPPPPSLFFSLFLPPPPPPPPSPSVSRRVTKSTKDSAGGCRSVERGMEEWMDGWMDGEVGQAVLSGLALFRKPAKHNHTHTHTHAHTLVLPIPRTSLPRLHPQEESIFYSCFTPSFSFFVFSPLYANSV